MASPELPWRKLKELAEFKSVKSLNFTYQIADYLIEARTRGAKFKIIYDSSVVKNISGVLKYLNARGMLELVPYP